MGLIMLRSPFTFTLLTFACLSAPADASAATFTVNLTQDKPDAKPGDGKCSYLVDPPANVAVCTLRAAIMEANATQAFDLVVLQNDATYTLTVPGRGEESGATGDLDIRTPLAINAGLFGRARIDAAGIDRVFDITADDVILSGLDITGGDPVAEDPGCYEGGGLRVSGAQNLRLDFLHIFGNTGCLGAVSIAASGVEMNYSEVSYNPSWGISSGQNDVNIKIFKSSIYNNDIYQINIQNLGKVLTLDHSTVSAIAGARGIFLSKDVVATITNSTIVSESEGLSVISSSQLMMENSIVVGNCHFDLSSLSGLVLHDNLYEQSCPSAGSSDNSLSNQIVFLSPLGFYGGFTPTHRPLTVSPAIDHTESIFCDAESQDQRGKNRKVAFKGGKAMCDIGAVELESDVIFFDSLEWF